MPTLSRVRSHTVMSNGHVGVLSAIEVDAPMANNGSGSTLISGDSAATWALILFIASIVMLYFVL